MNETLNEQISALIDDELTDTEQPLLIKRLDRDETLRQQLSRYQLISDALQDSLPAQVDPDFHTRVRAALRDEPVAQSASTRLGGLFKPLAGLAAAASVAIVAVLSLQAVRQQSPDSVQEVASAPSIDTYIRAPAQSAPVVAQKPGRNLDIYLVNHNEYAVNRGMLPYVRLVGQTTTVEQE